MEAMDTNGCFLGDDDFLNFTLDEKEEEKKEHSSLSLSLSSSSSSYSSCPISYHDDEHLHDNLSFPSEFVEVELEWLSNIDAFPSVETFLDILPDPDYTNVALDHHSPVSVLEDNSSSNSDNQNNVNVKGNGSSIKSFCVGFNAPISYPVGKRSKRRRLRSAGFLDFSSHRNLWWKLVSEKNIREESALPPLPTATNNSTNIGRRCLHCLAEKTPQWRAGPMGPKTLCNACGVRYKSGRLVPEYRPASSPTFLASLHSNSHRKIVEMRRQKQMPMEGMVGKSGMCI